MITSVDIKRLIQEDEGLHLETKACRDRLPRDIWETYSAFANTRGGVILLGVTEHKELPLGERFEFTGVTDYYKVITDFFNIVNNKQKVNRSVLVDSDVRPVEVDGVTVVCIKVPEADYRQKPIYINNNLQSGTFKRTHEGDRHVTEEELKLLIRDSSDNADSHILDKYGVEYIDQETLRGYRQAFAGHNPGHIYEKISDKEFLINLGGYASNPQLETEGLTAAGLLMFGKSAPIHQVFPNFRFDYLDLIGIEPGGSKKWNDRLTDDGRWVDNIYSFLTLALNRLLFTLPSEGKILGYPAPDIHEEDEVNEVWLTLPLPQFNVNGTPNVGDNVGDSAGVMSEIKITERQEEIINMIKGSPAISAKKMSETLSVTSRTVERDLASLKAMGVLMRRGTDNDGEWIILH